MEWLLLIISMLIALVAEGYVKNTYHAMSKVNNSKKITGQEVVEKILKNNKINIYTVKTKGQMTDHYDGARKVIRLSEGVFDTATIASIAIAAHEAGHAIQDQEKYPFYNIRKAIAPVAGLASKLSYVVIIIGLIFSLLNLFYFGVVLLMVVLVFQLVTLPVEFNASERALNEIKQLKLINSDEEILVERMLKAAAFTYVAGVITALLEITRLMLMSRD